MYGAIALAELERVDGVLSERDRCDRLDQLLTAVSSGWQQVMSLLDSWELDPWTRQVLRELQQAY